MSITIDQYLTAQQAADRVKITAAWFHILVAKNKGPASVLIGGHRFYDVDEVIRWDRERTAKLKPTGRKRKGDAHVAGQRA